MNAQCQVQAAAAFSQHERDPKWRLAVAGSPESAVPNTTGLSLYKKGEGSRSI